MMSVYTIGMLGYSMIEILWRGFTHWTMGLLGGIGFLTLYITEWLLKGKCLLRRAATGCMLLTCLEFLTGCIVNKIFHMDVWDYSEQDGNIMGQICPLYMLLWFLLCCFVMPFGKLLRKRIGYIFVSRQIEL